VKEVPVRPSTRFTRAPALLGATALLTASLAGCSLIPGFGGCQPSYVSGDASSLVTASGNVGSAPKVDFPTPLIASAAPQVSVITEGDGALIMPGDQVDFDFSLADGSTGDALGASGYDEEQFSRTSVGLDDNAVGTALECMHVGSRVALVSRWEFAKAAFDPSASSSFDDDATVVVVIEAIQRYLGKADGFNQLPRDGFPTVATAVDGTPGITVPAQAAPKTSGFSVIKGGDGAKLETDDKAVVHYSLWTWPGIEGDEPTSVGSTWDSHQAVTLALTDLSDGGGVPTGLLDALVGQRVGSQVLVILPPGDDSFPAGQGPAADDATYIFVVDLLGIQK
jgi:chitodextrinase